MDDVKQQVTDENPDLSDLLVNAKIFEKWHLLPLETKADYERKFLEVRAEYERRVGPIRTYATYKPTYLPLLRNESGGLTNTVSSGGCFSRNGTDVKRLGQGGPGNNDGKDLANQSADDDGGGEQVTSPPEMNNTLHIVHIMTKDKDGQLLIAINAMSQFKGKSLEELRDEDYNLLDDPNSLCESDRQALDAKIAGN